MIRNLKQPTFTNPAAAAGPTTRAPSPRGARTPTIATPPTRTIFQIKDEIIASLETDFTTLKAMCRLGNKGACKAAALADKHIKAWREEELDELRLAQGAKP